MLSSYKGNRRVLLRCGTLDGVDKGFDPGNPSAVAVLNTMQMSNLLRQPGHRVFVVRVSESSQMPEPCLGAVSDVPPTEMP